MTRSATPPVRLFLYACSLMPFMSLPYISLVYGIDFPFSGFFMLPVWTVDSLSMPVHELGHAITLWLFGDPAWISMSPEGSIFTLFARREPWILALIYFFMAEATIWCYLRKKTRALKILCLLIILHAALAFTRAHLILAMYMGQVAELVVATWGAYVCLFRGRLPAALPPGSADTFFRTGGVAAGIYIIFENILQTGLIMFWTERAALRSQGQGQSHGRHYVDDIGLAAEALGVGTPATASAIFVLAICCLAFLGCWAATWREES
ncbi:MAG: hypothetical protein EPN97_05640 [Alphaproteobacteria bacterium]|nr:MAG: hypothetical protein EPN97_05640 [Alphaproteobacteria bacterium]